MSDGIPRGFKRNPIHGFSTGTGIEPDLLPNIFDAFVTNKQRGTGLGLTITYDIVMKHYGRITAENNPDKGSTFKIWLPINKSEDE